jgi:hypothetical protein
LTVAIDRKKAGRVQVDKAIQQFNAAQTRQQELEAEVARKEKAAQAEESSLPAEPGAEEVLAALRRDQKRLEDVLLRQQALDLEERGIAKQETEKVVEAETPVEDEPCEPSERIVAAHNSKVASVRNVEWQLVSSRAVAVALAACA